MRELDGHDPHQGSACTRRASFRRDRVWLAANGWWPDILGRSDVEK